MWSFHEEITFQCLLYANTNNNMIKDDSVFHSKTKKFINWRIIPFSALRSTPRLEIEELRRKFFVVNLHKWKSKWLNLMRCLSVKLAFVRRSVCQEVNVLYVWLDESAGEKNGKQFSSVWSKSTFDIECVENVMVSIECLIGEKGGRIFIKLPIFYN